MKQLLNLTILAALACSCILTTVHAEDNLSDKQRTQLYNVKKKKGNYVALKGYDPISYFEANGPVAGKKRITSTHNGITYRFANESNKRTFDATPDKYMPQYGGWCAWAILDGDTVKVDPKTYEIIDDKLYLFYNSWGTNTKKLWNKKAAKSSQMALVQEADQAWHTIIEKKTGKRKRY